MQPQPELVLLVNARPSTRHCRSIVVMEDGMMMTDDVKCRINQACYTVSLASCIALKNALPVKCYLGPDAHHHVVEYRLSRKTYGSSWFILPNNICSATN